MIIFEYPEWYLHLNKVLKIAITTNTQQLYTH